MNKVSLDHHTLYERGTEALERGDFLLALRDLRRSARLIPHFKTYESIGECYFELGRYRLAVKYFAAAAGLGNKQFRAYYLLAKALIELGDTNGGKEKLNLALTLNPNYRQARELLSHISEDV